jgi:hypothetical protein
MFQCGVWAATFEAIFWDRIFNGQPGATAADIARAIWAELRSRGVLDEDSVRSIQKTIAPRTIDDYYHGFEFFHEI